MNNMINSAKKSKFQLPIILFPFIAFGLNLIGDMIGGNLAITICNQHQLSSVATNRILLLSAAVNALLVMLWVKWVECRSIRDMGLDKHSFAKNAIIGAVAGAVSFTAIFAIGYAMHIVIYQGSDYSYANVISVILMLPFWFVQAGAEELLIRGWVLPVISARSNRWGGILVSSALFVILHTNNAGFNLIAIINIFLVGVVLALYTLKSDSLWGAIMFHTLWNYTQGSILGCSVSGNSSEKPNLMNYISKGNVILSGGNFGIEASVITTMVMGILVGLLLMLMLRDDKSNKKSITN